MLRPFEPDERVTLNKTCKLTVEGEKTKVEFDQGVEFTVISEDPETNMVRCKTASSRIVQVPRSKLTRHSGGPLGVYVSKVRG